MEMVKLSKYQIDSIFSVPIASLDVEFSTTRSQMVVLKLRAVLLDLQPHQRATRATDTAMQAMQATVQATEMLDTDKTMQAGESLNCYES